MILLSLFAFEILVARPALREIDGSASPHMEALRERFRLLAVWSGFAAIVSGIVWFWIVSRTNGRREFVGDARHRFS
jgi:hypothetical protein